MVVLALTIFGKIILHGSDDQVEVIFSPFVLSYMHVNRLC